MSANLQVELYTPHAAQLTLHNSTARFRVCCSGRRFGKTLLCCNEMAKHALEHADAICMWVAPTYRQTQIAFRLMAKALRNVLASPANKSELRLELINGSAIQFASAERYDNLRGEGISFLVMDETAQIVEEAWTESLRPTLSDTGGRAIFIGTPRGRNWFWHLFQRGLKGSLTYNSEWESFTFPTSSNPYIPASEIEDVRVTTPEDIFRQEYLAEFLAESAGVFHNIDACVQGAIQDYVAGNTYLIGWDVAKHEDFSVVTVLNISTRHVDYWARFNKIDYTVQVEQVAEIVDRYHGSLVMDATGVGDPILEQIRLRGIVVEGVKFDNLKKEQHIRNLVWMLEHTSITFPYLPVLITELREYQYEFTAHGNVQYSAPPGKHDDAVVSLMLVAWKAKDAGDIPGYVGTTDGMRTPRLVQLEKGELDEQLRQSLMERQESLTRTFDFLRSPDYTIFGPKGNND